MSNCTCCPKKASGYAWEVPLCDTHFHAWWADAPMPAEVEKKATPEFIERVARNQYMPDTVVLKPGMLERYMTAWTKKWAKSQVMKAA